MNYLMSQFGTVPSAILVVEAVYVPVTLMEWRLRSKVYWGKDNRVALGLALIALFAVSIGCTQL